MTASRIGCLAWGSLVWDPRTLPRAGVFLDDGPWLPIEFSRVALDGRVTLVIDRTARVVRTHWVELSVESLDEAITELAVREKIAPEMRPGWVGRLCREDDASKIGFTTPAVEGAIMDWLRGRPLDAVVWTALPPRGPDGEATCPDFDQLLRHLEALGGEARIRAEEYIRRTPRSIGTDHRVKFEEQLGWVPVEGGD